MFFLFFVCPAWGRTNGALAVVALQVAHAARTLAAGNVFRLKNLGTLGGAKKKRTYGGWGGE
jgi:hypothetical protein